MNISAPPTSSRGNNNNATSRTSSLTNKSLPFHTLDSRSNSLKSALLLSELNQIHHTSNITPIRPLKSANSHRNSSNSLLRFSSNESSNAKQQSQTKSEAGFSVDKNMNTPKVRAKSLTTESSKKLDDFISHVKHFQQQQQQLAPLGTHSKSPSLQKPKSSLKHLGSGTSMMTDSPSTTDKKRLVKQFYEDYKTSSKGTNTPVRNDSLTSDDSPITPDMLARNIFDNFPRDEEDAEKEEEGLSDRADDKKTDDNRPTIERELLKLKFDIVNEVKAKLNQTEMDTLTLLNAIELKRTQLSDLNGLLLSKYDELQKQFTSFNEKDLSHYSLKDENVEFGDNLNELDSNLQKYRDIISDEKSLMADIDDNLEHLEKMTMEKFKRAKINRDRLVVVILLCSICYAVYFLKN